LNLSLAIVTKDSESYIQRLLQAGAAFADEIVVAIDASTTDRTEEICARYADKLYRIEPVGFVERALAWLNDQCSGDWILRLDDDELPSAGLVEALPRLMRDREITHYWLQRRWVVGQDQTRWLAGLPWWPDWQPRLFRNLPSIVRVPGRVHSSYIVQGDAQFIYEGVIYHYDLVYHSLARRQSKVALYDELSPGNRNAFLYLVPDDLAPDYWPDPIELIPDRDPPFQGSTDPPPPRNDSSGGTRRAVKVDPDEVRQARLRRADLTPFQDGQQVFQARLVATNCPNAMTAGECYCVDVEMRNDSTVIWPSPGDGISKVIVTYHWLQPSGDRSYYFGLRTGLQHTLRTAETTTLPTWVQAPAKPGDYVLQWDLLINDDNWFTAHGWQGPLSEVRVVDDASSAMQQMGHLLHPNPLTSIQPKVSPGAGLETGKRTARLLRYVQAIRATARALGK